MKLEQVQRAADTIDTTRRMIAQWLKMRHITNVTLGFDGSPACGVTVALRDTIRKAALEHYRELVLFYLAELKQLGIDGEDLLPDDFPK